MGVDFYNCDLCNAIYPDCGPCGNCEGCERSWCGSCDKGIRTFWYNGDTRCDVCWPPKAEPITDEALLELALEKFNASRDELEAELKASDDRYREKSFPYQCCEDHACGGADCENIDQLTVLDRYKNYCTKDALGICCKVWMPNDRDQWCDACSKTKKQKKSK